MSKPFFTLCVFMLLIPWARAQATQTPEPAPKPANSAQQDLGEAARQHTLAVKLFNEQKYDDALAASKRAVEIRERLLGADHYLTRLSLNNMAQMYIAKQNYGEALRIYQQLLPIYEKFLKPGDDELSKTLNQIGFLSFRLQKLGEAEKAFRRVLELNESAFGSADSRVASSLYQLASFYQFSGRGEQARAHYQRAVSIWDKNAGAAPPEYGVALERYSCMLRKTHREKESGDLARHASEVDTQSHAVTHAPDSNPLTVIQGGVINGRAILKPAPQYPEAARSARQEGTVVIQVSVNEAGNVVAACAISGPPLLLEDSELAAYAWRFEPTRLGGVPVRVRGTITFNFKLQ